MRKTWEENEMQIMRDNYNNNGAIYCAKLLNRAVTAVRRKARIMKLGTSNHKAEYGIELLSKTVAHNNSVTDVLKVLGLRCAGGNYNTINGYIKKYNLDTSHFETSAEKAKRVLFKQDLPRELILCENSTVHRSTVKRYIFKHNLIPNICIFCGQDENWYGKKMTLILDHENGIHNDNRLENLRIVCPNCNATLDTHCGKNKK